MRKIPDPPLLVITDRKLAGGGDRLLTVVESVFRGGCRWVLIREKDLVNTGELIKLTCKITDMARSYGAVVQVNTDCGAAAKCNASGVHLPWGKPVEIVRERLGQEKLLGVSAHSLEEALEAEKRGADYITLSPIFKPISKPKPRNPVGVEKLKEIASRVSIPVIALGGVTGDNARLCVEAGAAGVAVLGYVMASEDPERTVKEIISNLDEGVASA
ncbi:MAG TPA: thiamine phosphate synthase [Aigarchaeota archaeon]|nr:thiamine phosphate synthase [Aigarchaeota archaeon]